MHKVNTRTQYKLCEKLDRKLDRRDAVINYVYRALTHELKGSPFLLHRITDL